MKNLLSIAFAAAVSVVVTASGHAQNLTVVTPSGCPEIRAFNGECLNPNVAATARQRAIVLSNRKLSISSSPSLPNQDWIYLDPAWRQHLFREDHRGDNYIY